MIPTEINSFNTTPITFKIDCKIFIRMHHNNENGASYQLIRKYQLKAMHLKQIKIAYDQIKGH